MSDQLKVVNNNKSKFYNYSVSSRDDTYETPPEAYAPLLMHVPKTTKLWEPFMGSGKSTVYLSGLGYDVSNSDHADFFKQTTPRDRVFLTNPPFTLKKEIFKSLEKRKVAKGAILVRDTVMFTRYLEHFRQHIFKVFGYNLQYVLMNKIKFVHPDQRKPTPSSFYSVWVTWGLNLPKDIILPFEHEQGIEGFRPSLGIPMVIDHLDGQDK